MMDVNKQIGQLLQRRREQLPRVRQEIDQWEVLKSAIDDLDGSVEELQSHPLLPDSIKSELSEFHTQDLRASIEDTLSGLEVLAARYTRPTINIGVSGSARMGKSTLLQSISGLSDDQIPTGSGIPVTAVRSLIFHSATHQRATLVLHSFKTFRDSVLAPYHKALDLGAAPRDLESFQAYEYPNKEQDLPKLVRDKQSNLTILRRLREMQQSLSSYKDDLTGRAKVIDIAALRQYVAYPTNEEQNADNCARRYLAVREAKIECTFPLAQVDNLGIIDLPGLGELAADAEENHVKGLRNEVDFVLIVKRPVEGKGYWGKEDGAAMDLLDQVKGFIDSRGDFISILMNTGGVSSDQTDALRDDIRRKVNDGVNNQYIRVLEGDAKNPECVHKNVLSPILTHLAERLPAMDNQILQGTRQEYRALTDRIDQRTKDLFNILNDMSTGSASSAEDLDDRTVSLRESLASEFTSLVEEMFRAAEKEDDDEAYLDAVEQCSQDIKEWISAGLGKGSPEDWQKQALRRMLVDQNSSALAGDELNRIRVEISNRYSSLDNYFEASVESLLEQVNKVFKANLGTLLNDAPPRTELQRLVEIFAEASEPCPSLSEAINNLLTLQIEYRSQMHPRVRKELNNLRLQVRDPENGQLTDQVSAERTETGAELLFEEIAKLARQGALRTYQALRRDASFLPKVLHAAAEQFEDTLIRSGDSAREFKRFARSYKDEIWPGVYSEIDANNAKISQVNKSVRSVRSALSVLTQDVQ